MNDKKNPRSSLFIEDLVATIKYYVFVKPDILEIRDLFLDDEWQLSKYAAELIIYDLIPNLLSWRECNEYLFSVAKKIIPSNSKIDQEKERYLKNCDISHESLMLCTHLLVINDYVEDLIKNKYKLLKTICCAKFYILNDTWDLTYELLRNQDFLKQPPAVILNILLYYSFGGYPIRKDMQAELLSKVDLITPKHIQYIESLYSKHHREKIKFQLREGGTPCRSGGSLADDSKEILQNPFSTSQAILMGEKEALEAKLRELKRNVKIYEQEFTALNKFKKTLLTTERRAIHATEAKLLELRKNREVSEQRLVAFSDLINLFGFSVKPAQKPTSPTQQSSTEEDCKTPTKIIR